MKGKGLLAQNAGGPEGQVIKPGEGPVKEEPKPMQDDAPAPEGEAQAPDVSQEAAPFMAAAMDKLYGEDNQNLENLVNMFQKFGPEKFHKAMSTAIMGVLDAVEKEQGEMPMQVAAEVGVNIFNSLLEDLMQGGVVKDLSKEQVLATIQETLATWTAKNGDREGMDPQQAMAGMQQMAMNYMQQGNMG